jgi:AbrB family looped-hinge helix DNA binding protein
MTVRLISSKGWVVIPAELRRKYGLDPGSEVHFVDYGGVLAVIPALEDPIKQAAGMLKTEKRLTQILLAEHQNEHCSPNG